MGDVTDNTQGWMDLGDGVERRILCQEKALMGVEFQFETDSSGAPHSHPHVQTTFAASGRFEFTIDGVTTVLETGEALIIPSNVVHSCICLEKGNLIDSFTPRRDDFMEAHGLPLD
ncbi:MAG: cupin domain-containing protein [Sulfitobacter sp.]